MRPDRSASRARTLPAAGKKRYSQTFDVGSSWAEDEQETVFSDDVTIAEVDSQIEALAAESGGRRSGRTIVVVHSLPYVCTVNDRVKDAGAGAGEKGGMPALARQVSQAHVASAYERFAAEQESSFADEEDLVGSDSRAYMDHLRNSGSSLRGLGLSPTIADYMEPGGRPRDRRPSFHLGDDDDVLGDKVKRDENSPQDAQKGNETAAKGKLEIRVDPLVHGRALHGPRSIQVNPEGKEESANVESDNRGGSSGGAFRRPGSSSMPLSPISDAPPRPSLAGTRTVSSHGLSSSPSNSGNLIKRGAQAANIRTSASSGNFESLNWSQHQHTRKRVFDSGVFSPQFHEETKPLSITREGSSQDVDKFHRLVNGAEERAGHEDPGAAAAAGRPVSHAGRPASHAGLPHSPEPDFRFSAFNNEQDEATPTLEKGFFGGRKEQEQEQRQQQKEPRSDDDEDVCCHWVLHPRRGHASLNAGLRSLSTSNSLVVVARPNELVDGESNLPISEADLAVNEKQALETGLANLKGDSDITCVPVWIDDKTHLDFYDGFCKTFLWPIMHYTTLAGDLNKSVEERTWAAYVACNYAYARKVAEIYREGDLIWVQDYHLFLVPKILREMLSPKVSPVISLYLHAPFPSSEYFRCFARRESILEGIVRANLICFQTPSFARHFMSSCIRVMGFEAGSSGVEAHGFVTRVASCPIGLDIISTQLDCHAPTVPEKITAIRNLYRGCKIIVGRDKFDPVKGVLQKLRSFERFLREYPAWRNKVVLVQVTTPARAGDSPELAAKISEEVDHINALYGTLQHQPVHHFPQHLQRDEYFALLSIADMALVTSIREASNTTALEYIVCQKENHGVLVVSEFMGISPVLHGAIRVNPWDFGGVAAAIDFSLSLNAENRSRRHASLYRIVHTLSSAMWAHRNILQLLTATRGEKDTKFTPKLDNDRLLSSYKSSKGNKRLFFFDYDGTLTDIVKNPDAAVPSEKLLAALERITQDPNNIMYIISGRDSDFLEKHLGHIRNLGFSAEHGAYLRNPKDKKWTPLVDEYVLAWKPDVLEIFQYYEARTTGTWIEEKQSAVTFHYRNADPVFGEFQARECKAMLESMQASLPFDVLAGKKNLEVRPLQANKGEIVHRLVYENPDASWVMCAGDDRTDEDMFHALADMIGDAAPTERLDIEPPHSLTNLTASNRLSRRSSSHRRRERDSPVNSPYNRFTPLSRDSSVSHSSSQGSPDRQLSSKPSSLRPENIFTVAIDGNKPRSTIATRVLGLPKDVISALASLAEMT